MAGRIYGVALERKAPLRLAPHPDTPATQRWRRWALEQDRPRAVDLFAGCGGLSLGLEQAGYAVIVSVDNDPWCLETLAQRRAHESFGMPLRLTDRLITALHFERPPYNPE